MERSGQGDWLERVVPEVFSALVALQVPPASPALLVLTVLPAPKEIWAPRGSPAPQDSRASPALRVFLVPKGPSDHREKRDLQAGQGWPACLDLMDLLDILAKKVLLERKGP